MYFQKRKKKILKKMLDRKYFEIDKKYLKLDLRLNFGISLYIKIVLWNRIKCNYFR